jgi:beta-lactamase class A
MLAQPSRRALVLGTVSVAVASLTGCAKAHAPAPAVVTGEDELVALERQSGGRLGIHAVDLGSGRTVSHRQNERFPICSTFKLPLAAAVLSRVDSGRERLDRPLSYTQGDLLDHAPATTAHVKDGSMTVEALAEAAVTVSDNTAANLLLQTLGGPSGLTAYFRSLGDSVSRLDRNEPGLGEAAPGDPRDTTTPLAMTNLARRCVLGDALSDASRERLIRWMVAARSGLTRLRAAIPPDWRVGDKTGAGENGTSCDVAVAWPAAGGPILIAAYLTGAHGGVEKRNARLADAGRIVLKRLGV